MDPVENAIAELITVGRTIAAQGFVAGFDGNISVRLPDGRIVITRSQCRKADLTADDFVVLDTTGAQVAGAGRPSSEAATHLAAYELRPDVHAAIHAHPVECVALSIAGRSLDPPMVPEAVLATGPIASVPYATPSTGDLARVIRDFLPTHDTLLLVRHGSLTLGRTLTAALARLESLVHTARIVALATRLGPCEPLSPEEIARLEATRRRYNGLDRDA